MRNENGQFIKGSIPWHKGKHTGYIPMNKLHPSADIYGYVRRSRLVMEEYLGRYLRPKEVVHHIDKNTTNDRITNLMLFPSNSAHMKYHKLHP